MIKVALLGSGFMAKTHLDAYACMANVEVTAIARRRKDSATSFAFPASATIYHNLHDAIENGGADVVDICLPTFLHEQAVLHSAERGLHIVCEKPLALSVPEADRMVAGVEASGISCMVAHVLRFSAHYSKIKTLVESGELGEVFYASALRLSGAPQWAAWFRDPEKSGGALFDLHIHDLDYLLSLFGLPETVAASGVQSSTGAWDQICNILSYPDRKLVSEASYRMPAAWPFTSGLRIMGTRGCIDYTFKVDGNVDAIAKAEHNLVFYTGNQPPTSFEIEDANPYLTQLRYFIGCVEAGIRPDAVPLRQSRDVIAVLEATQRSLQTGNPIPFP